MNIKPTHTPISLFPLFSKQSIYEAMFVVARRFFSSGAVAETEKAAAEMAAKLQKEFSEQCANIMKVRGHRKLEMGTVKSKNGKEMTFDFSYGWPTRYYCKCNTSSEVVTKEAIAQFERELKEVGVTPHHAVYFSKGPFEGNVADLRPLFIDAKTLETMMTQKGERLLRSNKVLFFVVLSLTYLSWTFFSEKNPQRRRLIERWHRYVLKDEVKKPDPWAEYEAAQNAQTAVEEVVEKEQVVEEQVMVEPVVEEDVKPIVEMPMEETRMEEDKEEQKQEETAQTTTVWGYINSTFWWMLGYK